MNANISKHVSIFDLINDEVHVHRDKSVYTCIRTYVTFKYDM